MWSRVAVAGVSVKLPGGWVKRGPEGRAWGEVKRGPGGKAPKVTLGHHPGVKCQDLYLGFLKLSSFTIYRSRF